MTRKEYDMEKSYFEQLTELKNAIDSDVTVPAAEKEKIDNLLDQLCHYIWKYSA